MYLINYDFYDIHALITFFRSKPERFQTYKPALQKIIAYIVAPQGDFLNDNNIRNILKPYFDESDETISWVMVDNKYTANLTIIKKDYVYRIITSIFSEMMEHYDDSERFNLLCDVTHNLPMILVDKNKPEKTINLMIKEYRKKYNGQFLKNELKSM